MLQGKIGEHQWPSKVSQLGVDPSSTMPVVGLRFYRRLRVLPGMTVNLSKSGASMSFGVRGAHYTVGPRGRRVTVGLPGTGLYYTQHDGAAHSQAPLRPHIEPAARLRLGFFRRLVTPAEEQHLIDGLREFTAGREDAAFEQFRSSTHLPDGAMFAGILAFKRGLLPEAEQDLVLAIRPGAGLGNVILRYGVASTVSMQITPDVVAHLPHVREGALLALAEVYQRQGRTADAMGSLEEIRKTWPQDPFVIASLCELWLDGTPDAAALERVVAATDTMQNVTPVQTALFLYRARALRQLKLPDGAVQAATGGLSRRTDRSADLLRELRYERALAYGESGNDRRARSELEKLYAEDSTYADVATRLGVPPKAG